MSANTLGPPAAAAAPPAWPHERQALARWLAPAHQALGEQAQAAAWAEGQALSLEEAIALALLDG